MTEPAAPRLARVRPVLVTGGAGFIGANLVDRLACEGHDVLVYDALARPGVERNAAWLKQRHPKRVSLTRDDVRNAPALEAAAREACAVFHFAAQVAVTTSIVDPAEDYAVNLQGTFNLLESLRRKGAPIIFASTNKVYGDLADIPLEQRGEVYAPAEASLRERGVDETRPLQFHTPYGCSKGAADQYVLDYSRSFGLPAVVMRMSCIYGPHQMGTEDQGWVAHFLIRAMAGHPISIFGDGRQVRDILYVSDAVDAYLAAWRRIGAVSGRAFNLGGGPRNAVSLRQLIAVIEELIGRRVSVDYHDWRPGDQRYYVSDMSRATAALGLGAPIGWRDGVRRLADWLRSAKDNPLPDNVETAA